MRFLSTAFALRRQEHAGQRLTIRRGSTAAVTLLLLQQLVASADAEVVNWRLGGSGLDWSDNDTTSVLVDFETTPGAIQPIYLTPATTVFSHLADWSSLKTPRELGFEDGLRPRIWRGGDGTKDPEGLPAGPGSRGTLLVDGDSLSSNVPGRPGDFYTIDVAVPVPAFRFGFYTPPAGFRTDGTPKSEDIVRAYEVTIAEQGDPAWLQSEVYQSIGFSIGRVQENFKKNVQLEFPRQYVRFVRYFRGRSSQDETFRTASGGQAREGDGSIGDFELFAAGVPRRVTYLSKIIDLRRKVNFGRLHFATTSYRMSATGQRVETPDADVGLRVMVRTGISDDPNVYHEFTNTGGERIVSRDRYVDLSPRRRSDGLIQIGKPGIRASITYAEDNWSFWSSPVQRTGRSLTLPGGSHLQLRISLESGGFNDYVRLDSMWIEQSPVLATKVVGEVARKDNPRPVRGFTEVAGGEMTDFVYEIRADFDAGQRGYDSVRIRTGSVVSFQELLIGDPLASVVPRSFAEGAEGLEVVLPRAVTPANDIPVRLVFSTEVFVFVQTFEGEVFVTDSADLAQPVQAGDVAGEIGTNSLRVFVREEDSHTTIEDLRMSTRVVTPNGDQVNDELAVDYNLFGLAGSMPAVLNVYDLGGRRVARIDLGHQHAGRQHVVWDAHDDTGALLNPGVYVMEIAIRSEYATFRRTRPIAVAY